MFKKKFFRRKFRAPSSKIAASRIPKSIARVRTDWVSVFNVTDTSLSGGSDCQYVIAPWNPITVAPALDQCFSSFSFGVLDAARLTDLYGDDVKIVAMVGDMWLRPVFQAEDACFPSQLAILQAAWSNHFIRARGGLFKQRIVSSNLDVEGVVPHPLIGRDWSDAGFLKTWERNWVAAVPRSTATTYGEDQVIGVCPSVHQASYVVPAYSSGSGPTYTVPALSTDCNPDLVANEQCWDGPSLTEYVGPGWKRVSISSRRTIRMHEDDNLTWYIDWASLSPSQSFCGVPAVDHPPCAMHVVPSLKLKLQYG